MVRAAGLEPTLRVERRAKRREPTNYEAMRDLYFSEPASFDEIFTTLSEIENRINENEER